MNTALYIRVSTEEQKKFGLSLDQQEKNLREYCKQHNLKIYKVYKDEGISAGTIKKRKALVELLDDLNKFDIVLFTKLDRLSRNIKDAIEINELFKKYNVKMIATQDQYIDTSTANGEFIFNLRYALAQQERMQVSERINAINEYKRNVTKTSCSGKVTFGYKLDKDKHIVVDENDSKIIIDLFNHYAISNNLMETTRWYQNKYGKIDYVTIKRRLYNKHYIGIHEYNGKEVTDYYPPIINEELFDKVQRLLKMNIKHFTYTRTASKTIFNLLLYCEECGSSFAYNMNNNGNVYYRCRHRYMGCNSKAFLSEIRLEKYLLNNLPLELEKLKIKVKNITKLDIKEIRQHKQEINNKLARLSNLYIDGKIDYNTYINKYDNFKKELNDLDIEVPNTEEIEKILKKNYLEIYKTFTKDEKRIFWRSIIKRIEVKSDNTLTIKFMVDRF